ncbi:MAG: lytic transglycosylase [Aestuariivita sp.]|nr:lytic transglycosylase [Aestuariivita sp.]MCY4203315.1 lytic transglycosylase [Aestuariivita sp.]MCY4287159.1 lytic transglycosylase [Aestuariivita sp.]MCY4347533.1 lytic transglycosylase [Aestuariivita sp.]
MSRILGTIFICLFLISCGSGYGSPPRELENACGILQERPEYLKAFRAAERRWGIPIHVQMATIYHESSFISNARPPYRYALGFIPVKRRSTAYGYSQALDGTWDDYQRSTGNRWARRTNIYDAADFIGWYMVGSRRQLGIPLNDARNQYLAYHEGRRGYSRGSYRQKNWLIGVSRQVEQRSHKYQKQLESCRLTRRA